MDVKIDTLATKGLLEKAAFGIKSVGNFDGGTSGC